MGYSAILHPRECADVEVVSLIQWLLLLTGAVQARVEVVVLLTRK
jgi:hypothetical protein